MCHENEMGAAKEQHPYIICRLDKQRRWNSGGTVTRPLFTSLYICDDVVDEFLILFVKIPPIIGRDDFNL